MKNQVLGKLVGNTGDPSNLTMVMNSSFGGRRGEFVRIRHQERGDEDPVDVLGRIVSMQRSNVLYNSGMGSGVNDLELMPGAQVTGESLYAKLEVVGFKDTGTGQIRMPRRPLDPGASVETVDFHFLSEFYEFREETSLHLGNLVGYDRGDNIVPVYLDVNNLVTEHVAVLAMTGAGKSYTVGRIIERLVAINNATVVVFDPHGEYGKALSGGKLRFGDVAGIEDPRDAKSLPKIQEMIKRLTAAGAGVRVYTPQDPAFRHKYAGENTELALQFDQFEMDDLTEILPGLSEPQQRVLDVAIRYWRQVEKQPRDINRLRDLLGDDLEELKTWDQLSEAEASALSGRSAAVRDGRFFDALQILQGSPELLNTESVVVGDLEMLALEAYVRTERIAEAAAMVDRCIARQGDVPGLLLRKASLLGLQARFGESAAILVELNQRLPRRRAILQRLVLVHEQLRQSEKVEAFRKTLARVEREAGAGPGSTG